MHKAATFYFDHYYHIFNRTNNKEKLFKSVVNYNYFLKQYKKYLGDYLHIHAYALMSNHFHFSVHIKSRKVIDQYLSFLPQSRQTNMIKNYIHAEDKEEQIHKLILEQHRRFFISYSQAINKMFKRQGNLFNAKFSRSLFDPDKRFKYLTYYLHHNARKHGVVTDFKKYPYTSYHEIIAQNDWLIDVEYVISEFGSLNDFIEFHEEIHLSDKFEQLNIE